jgi:hypothetical protein
MRPAADRDRGAALANHVEKISADFLGEFGLAGVEEHDVVSRTNAEDLGLRVHDFRLLRSAESA